MASVIDLTGDQGVEQGTSGVGPECCDHADTATVCVEGRSKRKRAKKVTAADDQETPSRAKKAKAAPKKEKEQRVAATGKAVKFISKPPAKFQERIDRALPGSGHRMFLLSRRTLTQPGGETGGTEEFDILGTTGNVYKVTISQNPTCTCPDAARRADLCKHHFYVMARVLRLASDDNLMWQRGLLREEVDLILSGQRSQRTSGTDVMADADVLAAHQRMCSKPAAGVASSVTGRLAAGQRPVEGDCPICYDELKASAAVDLVVFCKACGNNVHKECFQRWAAAKTASGGITCVWCRAPWSSHEPASGSGSSYVNLASHSMQHANADTSLDALYGDRAVWIRASSGQISRRAAANLARAAAGRA